MFERLAKRYLKQRGYMVLKCETYTSPGEWIVPSGFKTYTIEIGPGGSGGAASSYDK